MTGNIYDKTTSQAKVCDGLQRNLEGLVLGQEHLKAVQKLCSYLEKLRQTGDFEAMLQSEKALITQDTEKAVGREPRIAGEMQRMERAERQAVKALICHEQLTKETDAYKHSVEYFSGIANDGYPKDSCREFLGSQGTRVNDCLRQPYNDAEASIFKARSANIAAMKRLYPALQASLLEKQDRGVESIRSAQAESKRILSNQNQKAQEAGLERQSQKARSKDKDRGRE